MQKFTLQIVFVYIALNLTAEFNALVSAVISPAARPE